MSKKGGRNKEKEAEDDALTVPVLQVGDEVPDFTCDSTAGLFNLHEVIDGGFAVLVTFLYPFDPVATTELGMLAKLKDEFAARETKLLCLAVDTKENARKWIEETQEVQDCAVWFPIVADHNAEVSRLLNLVKPKAVHAKRNLKPCTAVYTMDIDRRVRHVMTYPPNTGRNFYETLRAIDSMQLTLYHQVATPANWMNGEDVFIHPALATNAAAPLFPKGYNEIRSWLRTTLQPDT